MGTAPVHGRSVLGQWFLCSPRESVGKRPAQGVLTSLLFCFAALIQAGWLLEHPAFTPGSPLQGKRRCLGMGGLLLHHFQLKEGCSAPGSENILPMAPAGPTQGDAP